MTMTHETKALLKEIRDMNKKLEDHIRAFEQYVEEDIQWKEQEVARNQPVVEAFNNTSWLFRLFVATLKVVGLIGTAGGVFVGLYYALKTWTH